MFEGAAWSLTGAFTTKEMSDMKKTKTLFSFSLVCLLIATFSSCGGKPAAMTDIPVFPGAVELTAETSAVGDTLGQNEQADAALRKAMNAGGKIEQRAWQLPAGIAWPEVKSFYEEKLQAAGWQSGLGGIGGGFVDVNKMMETANQSNPMSQTMILTKGKQSLTLIMLANPADPKNKQLIASLATN